VTALVASPARWRLRFDERPFTANQERRWHHHRRAEAVRRWREAFALLARQAAVPSLTAVEVTVTPHLTSRRGLQDVGGCFPAAKAAIDGLVDAGVLADDGPDHLHALTFLAPVIGQGDALVLAVREVR
jgi:crossover junction endodeoxyribonuclease RusA